MLNDEVKVIGGERDGGYVVGNPRLRKVERVGLEVEEDISDVESAVRRSGGRVVLIDLEP